MDDPPSIKDVAAMAGVSPSTVSVVLNAVDGARVADETRRRVTETAVRLGYEPHPLARGLRTRRSQTIGFVSDLIATSPYAGQLIQGAQESVWHAGMLLILANTGRDAALEQHALRTLGRRQVDGLIYASMYHRVVEEVPKLRRGLPLVLLDARPAAGAAAWVVPDEVGGGAAAATELLAHGHCRIGYVAEWRDIPAVAGRLQGYRQALARHGVAYDPALVRKEEPGTRGGYHGVARLLQLPDPPTAVCCFTDAMAMGAYQAAADHGLRIPGDLSVVGYDDHPLIAPALRPGLTTVALPHYEMGAWAATTLLDLIDTPVTPPGQPPHKLMPCLLVRRDSIGPPPR